MEVQKESVEEQKECVPPMSLSDSVVEKLFTCIVGWFNSMGIMHSFHIAIGKSLVLWIVTWCG